MIAIVLGVLACLAWMYLILGRGGFWRAQPRDETDAPGLEAQTWPHVAVIVPARDEAEVIGAAVAALLRQDYPGELSIVVVDDESTDGTATQARRAAQAWAAEARVALVRTSPRPDGWTGKLWAVSCGIAHVQSHLPAAEFLLLTDADIVHATDSVRALVGRARRERLVLASRMAKLRCTTWIERAFIPAFVFFFAMLYPFAWVNRRDRPTAAAAGGCMLVQRAALERAGGVAQIRGALIDDCALAQLMKEQGAIWLGLTERVQSLRPYTRLADVRSMIVRSAYAQLRFSPLRLAATCAGMILIYLVPPALAIFATGAARLLGLGAWTAMTLAFRPTLRFYRVSPLWGVALPAIAAAYVMFTVDSAYQSACGRTGQWKGRVYPARRT